MRLVAAALAAVAFLNVAAVAAEPPRALVITSAPILSFEPRDPERRRFGALQFRGGLILKSSEGTFGELSGLVISPDGQRFVSVSDKGRWFRGRIVYRDGAPDGIADAETAPVLGPDGEALGADTESVAEDNGTLYVGIERIHRVMRFDYARDGLRARGVNIDIPHEARTLPFNKGLEALTFVSRGALAGTLIAISERGLDANGDIVGFLIGGSSPGIFSVARSKEFDVTDSALLPNGDLLILERHFSIPRGPAMRIRRIAQSAIRPGATVDGPVLIEADFGYEIDNMEGLAVHRTAQGETVLTIVSDDNASAIQRTILLQFTLAE